MRIQVTKGATADRIDVSRQGGSVATTSFPHKGPLPHDVVHFFVELELQMDRGFWGLVAAGSHPEEIAAMAKAAGHASASRRCTPEPGFVTAIQAERIVECFEADLWGGGCDDETFVATLDAACEQSLLPRLAIEPEQIKRIRHQLANFRDQWLALPVGRSCAFDWPEDGPRRPA